MAGTQNVGEASENPVGINVTAMVDVIFCLCIFFMCSFHFKQLEGKVDTWLPRDKGPEHGPPRELVLQEIRVFLRWDPEVKVTTRRVGNRGPVARDEELVSLVLRLSHDYRQADRLDVPVIIDATEDVPWQDVVHVMDLMKREKIDRVELTAPCR